MRAVGLLVFASEFSYLHHRARHAGGGQVGWVAHLGRRHTQHRSRGRCPPYSAGGINCCQADSGSPRVWRTKDSLPLVGSVSFGEGGARKLKYAVYSRVSVYSNCV